MHEILKNSLFGTKMNKDLIHLMQYFTDFEGTAAALIFTEQELKPQNLCHHREIKLILIPPLCN